MAEAQPQQTVSRDEVLGALVAALAAGQASAKAAAEQAKAAQAGVTAASAKVDELRSAHKRDPIPGRREADGSLRFQLAGQWWIVRPNGDIAKSEVPSG